MANGTKFSQFSSASGVEPSDVVVGLKNGGNRKFSFAIILAWIKSVLTPADIGAASETTTINGYALDADVSLSAVDVGAVDAGAVGVADGVASLDGSGKVPGTQLDLSNKQDKITASGMLKGDGAGGVSPATPGTDFGTYSKPAGGIPETDLASGVQTSLGKADSAYQKPSGGIPASDLASGVIPSVPSAYASNPAMDGTASPGSSGSWARGDHVHPTDTSRQAVVNAAGILKGDGAGGVSAAQAGTDYQAPLTFDAAPAASSNNPVTSGGIYTAIRERMPVSAVLWSGNTAVASAGTTISLDDNWSSYAWIMLVLNTASGGQSASRMVACLPSVAVQYTGYYLTQNSSASGIVRVGRPTGQTAQLILYNINFAALYITAIYGIK